MLTYALVAGVLFGLYFSLVGIGLNLVFGVMRIVNLAHGDCLMLGAFIAVGVVTLLSVDPLFAVPLAFVIFLIAGLLLYWVLVPRLPDHPLVHWAGIDYLGDLLPSGVRVFLFQDGFLHAKTIVVDGAVASIGSANWDIRSFMLNFETNAIIYCRSVAVRLEEAFFQDLTNCREWTLQDHLFRPPWLKAKCAFSRLFSPIL
jgi:branched-subunit amino acid ABC-type transport system permease component